MTKSASLASLIAAVGLFITYAGLCYLGACASSMYSTADFTQPELIVTLSQSVLGYAGFVVLALMLMIRLIKGPSVADRAVAADSIDILSDMALILYALHTGRGIYLDIALITAILGFVGSTLVAKYLEGKL